MKIQDNGNYQLEVSATYLDRDVVHLCFTRHDDAQGISKHNFFMEPQEMATLVAYLNDFLCH